MAKPAGAAGGKSKVKNAAFKGFKDGSSEFLGDQVEAIVGYSKETFNSHQMKWVDLVLNEDKASMRQAFVHALKGDKTYMREYRVAAKNGDCLWIREWGQIVCDDTGEMDFATGIIMDITEEKEQEMLLLKNERKTGKYLTFSMAGEEYGITILKVKEIIEVVPITPVPQAPPYLKGVVNLRGKVIPVVDMRTKLGMEAANYSDRTCIIVLETEHRGRIRYIGVVVDSVSEVLHIRGADIEDTPDMIDNFSRDCILGMAKIDRALKIILDVDKVLGETELDAAGNF